MDDRLFQPLKTLQWVDRALLKPNDYNPNKVSKENLRLLTQSILTNGWTLPLVVRADYTIIDGFHRWTVAGEEPLLSALGGMVPVVIVDHSDESEDIYGTITHNRARGAHLLGPMKAIIQRLINEGKTVDEIGRQLGMRPEEIFRLSDFSKEDFLSITIGGLKRPLFAYLKMPGANAVDPSSPLGVSMFSRAVNLIEDADRQYTRLLWEYEGGEMAIEASKDVFPQDKDGKPVMPAGRERLFRPNELDQNAVGAGAELLKVHAPTLRDASYTSGLYTVLKQIEDKCGMARGTITDPANAAKTATEIKMLKQPSYVTITNLQKAIEDALNHVLYIMDKYATLYNLAPNGKYAATFKWDDSVITDTDSERMRDKDDVAAGLMQPYEYRMKWYGEDESTAKKMVGYVEPGEPDDENDPFGLNKPDKNAPSKGRKKDEVDE